MLRSARVSTAVLGIVLLVPSRPATALDDEQPRRPCSAESLVCADAEARDGRVDIGAADGAPSDEPVDWGGNTQRDPSRCTFGPVPDTFDRERDPVVQEDIPRRAVWYVRNCDGRDEYRWYVPGSSDSTDPVLQLLVERALDTIEPPAPQLVTSPPLGSEVLTGFPMYLSVDDAAFREHTGTVTAGAITVTATITPVTTWFSPGDQHEPLTCEGAGSRWAAGERPTAADCTHTFTHTPAHLHGSGETYPVTSRVTYEASYTVTGPVLAGTYDLGAVAGPESTVEVTVIERRAVRTTAGS